ncbi:MAG: hypothetical protein V3R87_09065 [Dehalococcoidia bacterium]
MKTTGIAPEAIIARETVGWREAGMSNTLIGQVAPRGCRMQAPNCANCDEWEPIPFHDNGGVCLPKAGIPVYRQTARGYRTQNLAAARERELAVVVS